jgi:adhesin transport system outer membrane protein
LDGRRANARPLIPRSLNDAIDQAHANHPSIQFAQADIDAAAALVKAARSKYYPNVSLEGRASAAEDISGIRGFDGDLQGNVVVRWNLYNGGIDAANEQEQIRHVDEEYQKLHRITREVEEGVQLSWDRHMHQTQRLRELLREMSAIEQLRGSYFEQFRIGERSLLDLLDTQNTRFSVQVAIATADAAVKFSYFRILAATGKLLRALGIAAPAEARTYARVDANVPETPLPESFNRVEPPRPVE